ncbi:MAG: glucose PTS transporter subunit IIA [Hungatella sp.]|uniref:glucose PTS transporter subunit IIA n=1 Tax=Hungatella sp. TaxID=2613924 RepID=UPI00399AD012
MAKKKLDYGRVAENIIANIGGRENVVGVRHCITRVRFKLKDEGRADDDKVKNLEGVISVVHGGGEYMVVIGDAVTDVYEAVCDRLGTVTDSDASEEKERVNPVMKVLNIVVGAVGPCLNFICAGGILKGLLTILEMSGLVLPGSGIDLLIHAAGDAIFFFLPIFLGMNLAKTLKGDSFLGAIIGAALCYPAINGADLVILGRIFNYTYTSSFLPVIAITAVAVPLSKLLKKHLPKAVSNFLTPAVTLLIVLPLGFIIIGPVVGMMGNLANTGITALMNSVPLVAGAVFGGLYQVMVLFGIHSALTSFSFMNLLEGHPDAIMAIGCMVSFAQIGVVLAMYLKSKDEDLKAIALPAFISGIFGVTEPAIYGVTLPRIKMFVLSCVGGAVCGAFVMFTNTLMYNFTGLGVFAVLGLISPESPNLPAAVLCAVVPFVASFAAAYLFYKDEKRPETFGGRAAAADTGDSPQHKRIEITSPVPGKVVSITEVPDETFSSGMLGKGFAVEPSEGKVYAPFDGECTTIFETLHAMGLTSDQGVSLLIHVGLETVSLDGKPFTAHIKSGDPIKKGQLLLEFDMDEIRAAGCPTITPVLVANEAEVGEVTVEHDRIIVEKR